MTNKAADITAETVLVVPGGSILVIEEAMLILVALDPILLVSGGRNKHYERTL